MLVNPWRRRRGKAKMMEKSRWREQSPRFIEEAARLCQRYVHCSSYSLQSYSKHRFAKKLWVWKRINRSTKFVIPFVFQISIKKWNHCPTQRKSLQSRRWESCDHVLINELGGSFSAVPKSAYEDILIFLKAQQQHRSDDGAAWFLLSFSWRLCSCVGVVASFAASRKAGSDSIFLLF